ncbi:MAG: hypothetical protein KKD86_06555 [Bacteroidetes bacterium]|nr:hypothetical protein [Bacteroidota bacterium]
MNKQIQKIYLPVLLVIGTGITLLIIIYGFDYYVTQESERFFHSLHKILKPSGAYGHGMGIVGSLMMMFGVAIYMIRKRVRKFSHIGFLKYWLQFHIFLCSVGPILVLFHTAFKFGGIIAISFYSMIAVVISGVIGRFIYVQIPRSIQGQELSFSQLDSMNAELTNQLKSEFNLDSSLLNMIDSYSSRNISEKRNLNIFKMVFDDYVKRRRFIKNLKTSGLVSKERYSQVLKLTNQKLILERKINFLHSAKELFKYWHVAHLPFALIMLIIMIIHTVVAITFGYRWLF